MPVVATDQGWVLRDSEACDIDQLMSWFSSAESVLVWGGPTFRYPFNRHSFAEDMRWGRMASFSLFDPTGNFAAFGQLYERIGRINFARLVANPAMRGEGVGKRLIGQMMVASRSMFACDEYSLFVYRDNKPAYECYKSMGFVVTDFPDGVPYADVCYYLTRPVIDREI